MGGGATTRRLLRRAPLALVLALPLLLLHATSIAEVAIALVDAAFVLRCVRLRRWAWLRTGWVPIGIAWWAWLVLCSLPGIGYAGLHGLGEALACARYLLFAAALERDVLATRPARRWMWRAAAASVAYYAVQCLAQFAFGRNLFGMPRAPDGVLTDPIGKGRIAAPLARLMPAVVLPLAARGWLWALVLLSASTGLIVLIGQRMPLLLTAFGLVVAGLLLRRLRPAVLAALVAGAALVAATAIVSPPVFARLVTRFSDQMEHFRSSDYGVIADRAVAIAEQHPWHGRGFDGYRSGCMDPRYFRDWTASLPPTPGEVVPGCNIHPHNHYLQAVTDAGVPGLLLWCALVIAWLAALGRGLWWRPDPLRVGLFVGALLDQWPIASTSSMFAVEIEGFFFLILGWGLAEARSARRLEGEQRGG
jgi:O-antigen ligase